MNVMFLSALPRIRIAISLKRIISAFPNFKKSLKKIETPSLSGFVRSQQFYS
jgi:hypothetical protein